MIRSRPIKLTGTMLSVCVLAAACDNFNPLNPAFTQTFIGGQVPVTPGPGADFILVRGQNDTGDFAEYIVTIEREVFERDDDGNVQLDENGQPITRSERNTISLLTSSDAPANDQGVLFSCAESPINIIGLGENLLADDTQLVSGGAGAGGAGGVGIRDPTLTPLSRAAGNFACGDTIIFRAIRSTSVAGGIKIDAFRLAGFDQPSLFNGPSTFVNYQDFIESQVREDE